MKCRGEPPCDGLASGRGVILLVPLCWGNWSKLQLHGSLDSSIDSSTDLNVMSKIQIHCPIEPLL